MSEIVYWLEYDEPKKTKDIFGKDLVVTGEWATSHPLLDRAWFWVGFGGAYGKSEDNLLLSLELMFKDGERKNLQRKAVEDDVIEKLKKEAAEYIENRAKPTPK